MEEIWKILKSSNLSNHSPEFHKAKAGESISERKWRGSSVDILSMSRHRIISSRTWAEIYCLVFPMPLLLIEWMGHKRRISVATWTSKATSWASEVPWQVGSCGEESFPIAWCKRWLWLHQEQKEDLAHSHLGDCHLSQTCKGPALHHKICKSYDKCLSHN